jgi:uncharacterized protein (DUF1501 family)
MTPPPTLAEFDVSRRDFLRVGGAGVVGLSLVDQAALARGAALSHRRRVIFILMAGGPSQLDTFDPKPEAPSHIRGPLRAIATRVPGVWLSESLPQLAQRADRFALIRSLTHDYAPIHETGQQLLQCGRLVEAGVRFPHFGSIVARTHPRTGSGPQNVVLPRLLDQTGTHQHRGQSAGGWGAEWNPLELTGGPKDEPDAIRRSYGDTQFGRLLLQARQLVEQGTSCVTVNLFDTLHQRVTWDCHGDAACAPGTIADYRDTLCPQFDQALSALLDDLQRRGLLDDTLVVTTGEFGRTPHVNPNGGRDHWTGCWSALVAGGGVTGGAVLGASDHTASAPIDRPVTPPEITATLLSWFGIDGRGCEVAIGKKTEALIPAEPLRELWA